jgi:hypothetical protein
MRHLFFLTFAISASTAPAAEVFINGVNVAGLTGQTFEKVNVRLDEKGNVHIDAPGYSVKRVAMTETADAPRPEATITKKYFLVTEQNVQGLTEYDVEVFLNGALLRTVSSNDPQLVTEVTKSLRPGRNAVTLRAKKKLEVKDQPKSTSKANLFRVILGEGETTNDQVVIDKQLITFTRTAAEQGDVTQEFAFTTR